TFDPIHWGHLRSAEEVREAFGLSRVLFIPAANPPHRIGQPGAPARHRLEMVRLAVAKNPGFGLSTVEVSRPGKSYSIDTLRYFAAGKRAGQDAHYFILGLDAFREICSWKDFEEIFPLCHLIVTSRAGCTEPMSLRGMPVAVRRLFCYHPAKKAYQHQSGTFLYFYKITDIGISASGIRRLLMERKSIRYLVPLEVATYIRKRGLYQRRRGGR
ncbi:MAG: nicotinate (nicotinamide) nucleotide adenylyltransferase, partial [Deltaproteobacteria bacterium]|nr:nicotinate (nicotinamide) nucleotide adenylyltransferase [Deltaproteobacteria bacterium]